VLAIGASLVKKISKYNIIFVVLFSTLLLGCGQLRLPKMATPPSPEHTSMSAPQTDHLSTNLYGELKGWKPYNYMAKPSGTVTQHSFAEEGGDADPALSPDGKWIVFSSLRHSPNPDVYIKSIYGSTVTRLTSDPASEMQPCFSPKGDKVVYSSNRSGSWDIWVVGVDGTSSVQLTNSACNDIHASWSPDGQFLVYSSFGIRSNQWEIWILDVMTPTRKFMVGYGLNPVWCPNPTVPKIAYQAARFRGSNWYSIWTIDFVEGEAKFPTEIVSNIDYACISPAWSKDGSKISYGTVTQDRYDNNTQINLPPISGEAVYMIDLDGRNNLRLTNDDASSFSPSWGPNGRVFYCSDRKGISNIWSIKPNRVDFKRAEPVDLSHHPLNRLQAN